MTHSRLKLLSSVHFGVFFKVKYSAAEEKNDHFVSNLWQKNLRQGNISDLRQVLHLSYNPELQELHHVVNVMINTSGTEAGISHVSFFFYFLCLESTDYLLENEFWCLSDRFSASVALCLCVKEKNRQNDVTLRSLTGLNIHSFVI